MLQIRLDRERPARQPDPLGRDRIGYWQGMSQQEALDSGRGLWRLKADRVLDTDELQITDPTGIILAVGRITGVSKHRDRRAVEAELIENHPRVGKMSTSPNMSSFPIAYIH